MQLGFRHLSISRQVQLFEETPILVMNIGKLNKASPKPINIFNNQVPRKGHRATKKKVEEDIA